MRGTAFDESPAIYGGSIFLTTGKQHGVGELGLSGPLSEPPVNVSGFVARPGLGAPLSGQWLALSGVRGREKGARYLRFLNVGV